MKLTRLAPLTLLAASAAGAQQQPPIRPLGAVTAKASETLGMAMNVRHLPGGKVLVNDLPRRRVLMFDETLSTFTVIADSTSATANAYSGRIGGLIPYRGDSTLFVDPFASSMMMIDPSGKLGRVMSVPRGDDAMALAGPFGATAGFDAKGRLVYRTSPRFVMNMVQGPGGAPPAPPQPPDSALIVAVDLATRKVDTLGSVKIPKVNMQMNRDAEGRMSITREVNPLPVVDEWAVTSDGKVALVRGRDYHVDWITADGKASSPKVPFEWQRLSDEDKVALIDSVKIQRARQDSAMAAQMRASGGAGAGNMVMTGPNPGAAAEVGMRMSMTITEGAVRGGSPPPSGAAGPMMIRGGPGGSTTSFVAPSELPDYKPPFFAGAVRADADGNLWVQTIPTRKIEGGPVFDVINGKGELVDRVQIPAGRTLAGFGPGGVVYLTSRAETGLVLERASVR